MWGLKGLDKREKVARLQGYVDHLLRLRRPWAEVWEDVRQVARPGRRWGLMDLKPPEQQAEDLVSPKITDNAATRALRTLSSGLHSGLTPPSRAWFALRLKDDGLMEYGPVKYWLAAVEKTLYSEFARSNFYPAIHAVYANLAAYCSGCLSMQGRSGRGLHFQDTPIGSFVWDADADGAVHTIARHVSLPAGELVAAYGREKVSHGVRNTVEKEPFKRVDCVHLVTPRAYGEREPGKLDRANKAFASYLWEMDSGELVDEGGFDDFPALCARWDVLGGEIYGRGACFDNLPDVRMLQTVSRDQSMAIRMSVTPAMKIPASLKGQPLYLIPGAKNYVSEAAFEKVGPLYEVRADIAAASAKLADLRQSIKEGYFNDLFMMLSNSDKTMTAYEVAQRNSEKLLMLGPVIERHQTDILDPCISSTYARLEAMGAIPPPPEEIQGLDIEVSFISVLAQAQRLSQATATRNLLADVGGMAQLNPDILDKIDFDQVVDTLADIEGAPPAIVRPDEAVTELRQQRAEAQAEQARAMQEQAQEQQLLAGLDSLGRAKTEGTALGALAEAAGLGGLGAGAGTNRAAGGQV